MFIPPRECCELVSSFRGGGIFFGGVVTKHLEVSIRAKKVAHVHVIERGIYTFMYKGEG